MATILFDCQNKTAIARRLIELGDTRKLNTLRKLPLHVLQDMLPKCYVDKAAYDAMPATLPVIELPQVEPVCHTYVEPAHIPTDKELYQAALAPKLELVMLRDEPAPAPMNRWLALAMVPFMMLGRIMGM